jgi:hypothetical protein
LLLGPQYPKVVGVRLSVEDAQKLTILSYHSRRPPSELIRLLIRTAQPVDVPPVRFAAAAAGEGAE